jgi:hypothetical protein
MIGPNRLDPLSFTGCFAYLASDVPPGLMLSAWRAQLGRGGVSAGADRPPQGRTLRARRRAHRPRSGRGPSARSHR